MLHRIMSRLGRVVRAVIHDPEVGRAGKSFAVLIAVRVALALGASVEMVDLARRVLGV